VQDDRHRSGHHKRTHALAAVDASTGQLLGEREIAATEQGHLEGLRWARELGHEIAWAIEDCRHVSQRFERSLVAAGERVLRVAPIPASSSASFAGYGRCRKTARVRIALAGQTHRHAHTRS
jgi:hypothetical protein